MKRFFSAFVVLSMLVLAFASCGVGNNGSTAPTTTAPKTTASNTTTGTPPATPATPPTQATVPPTQATVPPTQATVPPTATSPEATTIPDNPPPPPVDTFANRWDNVNLPSDVLAAMQDLYTLYDERIPAFFASLYDPATGAFYFSGSARDYEGFAPDIESTAQILQFFTSSGMVNSTSEIKNKLPAETVTKLTAFVQAMQDPDDGYFYHTQWGKNINDTRRGRDLSWAIEALDTLGASPLYPTATDRLNGTTSALYLPNRALFAPEAISLKAPAYLQSEAAFIAYLDELTAGQLESSYSWANTLNALTNQIISAGLGQVAVDYFNAKMNPETGLWSSSIVSYHTVSAIMKMGSLYTKTGNSFPYPEKTLASCISVAKGSETPSTIVFIYNPWSAISSLRATLKTDSGYTKKMLDDALLSEAAAMLAASKTKLALFQKEDGTFSYYQNASMTTSQAVPVGLGLNEGDVNATKIALASTLSSIWGALGEPIVSVYPTSMMDEFADMLRTATAPEKKPQPVFEGSFETGTTDGWSITAGNGNSIEIIDDPTKDGDNHVICISKNTTGTNDNFQGNLRENVYQNGDKIVFTFDFYLDSIDIKPNPNEDPNKEVSSLNHCLYQIDFLVGGARYYMLTATAKKGDFTTYTFGDSSSTGSGAVTNKFDKELKVDTWYTITLELTVGDADTFAAKISVDGEVIGESTNYYGSEGDKGITKFNVTALRFRSQQRAVVTTYFDNVSVTYPRANDDGE